MAKIQGWKRHRGPHNDAQIKTWISNEFRVDDIQRFGGGKTNGEVTLFPIQKDYVLTPEDFFREVDNSVVAWEVIISIGREKITRKRFKKKKQAENFAILWMRQHPPNKLANIYK